MNKIKYMLSTLGCCLAFLAAPSVAADKMNGVFTVEKSCDAHRSIRKQSKPTALNKGQKYTVKAKNKPAPSHYLIDIPNQPIGSWVAVECGSLKGGATASSVKSGTPKKSKGGEYLLALSWQPGFCSTHKSKKECKNANSSLPSAKGLSLHGLWPQPRNNAYCGVSEADKTIDRRGRWDLLKKLDLTSDTIKALNVAMPGYVSKLQRHEWIKHGTCYSKDAETYYKDSIRLTNNFNDSPVAALMKSSKGKSLTLKAIRASVAKSFGKSAASRVALRCGRKNQITELWIGLKGDAANDSMQDLMVAGKAPSSNCQSGLVARY